MDTPDTPPRICRTHCHQGSALVVALVFLVVLAILGLNALRGSTLQERMAGNARDRDLAFQAAETALRAGEAKVDASDSAAFVAPQTQGHSEVFWSTPTSGGFATLGKAANTVAKVDFGDGVLANSPIYVIEQFEPTECLDGGVPPCELDNSEILHRVTATSDGGSGEAVVVLQSTYK